MFGKSNCWVRTARGSKLEGAVTSANELRTMADELNPSGNKETYVIAERKGGHVYWTLISYYDWSVNITDDLDALHINPL